MGGFRINKNVYHRRIFCLFKCWFIYMSEKLWCSNSSDGFPSQVRLLKIQDSLCLQSGLLMYVFTSIRKYFNNNISFIIFFFTKIPTRNNKQPLIIFQPLVLNFLIVTLFSILSIYILLFFQHKLLKESRWGLAFLSIISLSSLCPLLL